MPAELLSRDLVHTVDAIELPPLGTPVEGRSERRDSYPIVVTRSFEQTVEQLLELIGDARVAVITDETVAELYGPVIVGALAKSGLEPEVATVPAGERHKTPQQALELLDWLTGTQVGRRDVILNLGGGVVIDMGGFVASCVHARRPVHESRHDSHRASRCRDRRKIGGQPRRREEPDRRLLPAARGDLERLVPEDDRPPPAARGAGRVDQEGDHRVAGLLEPDRDERRRHRGRRPGRARAARARGRGDQGGADRARSLRGGLAPDARLRPRDRPPPGDGDLVQRAPARGGGGIRNGRRASARGGAPSAPARAPRAHPGAAAARGAANDLRRAARRGRR